jgi:hypothetical protein
MYFKFLRFPLHICSLVTLYHVVAIVLETAAQHALCVPRANIFSGVRNGLDAEAVLVEDRHLVVSAHLVGSEAVLLIVLAQSSLERVVGHRVILSLDDLVVDEALERVQHDAESLAMLLEVLGTDSHRLAQDPNLSLFSSTRVL